MPADIDAMRHWLSARPGAPAPRTWTDALLDDLTAARDRIAALEAGALRLRAESHAAGVAKERAQIVVWLRSIGVPRGYAAELSDRIERGEHAAKQVERGAVAEEGA